MFLHPEEMMTATRNARHNRNKSFQADRREEEHRKALGTVIAVLGGAPVMSQTRTVRSLPLNLRINHTQWQDRNHVFGRQSLSRGSLRDAGTLFGKGVPSST